MRPPRAVLMIHAPRFIFDRLAPLTRCRFSGVSGQLRDTTSDIESRDSRSDHLDPEFAGTASVRHRRCRSRPRACPCVAARRANRCPMSPRPTIPSVRPASETPIGLGQSPSANVPIHFVQMPREHDEISDHDIGDLVAEHARRIRHPNSQFLGGPQVDRVRSHAPLGHDPESVRALQYRPRDVVVPSDDSMHPRNSSSSSPSPSCWVDRWHDQLGAALIQSPAVLREIALELNARDQDPFVAHAVARDA